MQILYTKNILGGISMKVKKQFVLKNVADNYVVMPLGDDVVDLNGMLTLNESGVLLWNALEAGASKQDLVKALTDEYDVSDEIASKDVDAFVDALLKIGCIED